MASSRGSTASSKPPKQRLAVTAQSATSKPWFTCSQPNSISCFQTEIVATHAKQRRTEKIHSTLYVKCREQDESEASPTACIVDSQSVKSAEKGGSASMPMDSMPAS